MKLARKIQGLVVAVLLLGTPGPGVFASGDPFPPCWRYRSAGTPAASREGMVVTADSTATEVGVEILRAGGSAVDAAVAVCFALAVTLPEAGNLGGGGFLLLRTVEGVAAALDFRETAPSAATREMYLDRDGNPTLRSLYGALAAGVPGTVAGMWEVHQRYGRLPWGELLAPAIALAEEGFTVRPPHHEAFVLLAGLLRDFGGKEAEAFEATAATFLPQGRPPAVGERFRQPDLAATLRRIAAAGPDGFYGGETAERIVAEMEADGGILSREDLRAYAALWRDPLRFGYRNHTILTMPPVSSGGATMAEIANILSGYDLASLEWGSAERIHLFVEAAKRAYADRNTYLGDPAFVTMPIERMLSAAYADERRATISATAATPSAEVGPGLGPLEHGGETTHVSIVDGAGNAVAITTTINTRFGSLVTVRGAGFLLNNEMDDFTARPGVANYYGLVQGAANAIQPGKRMLSSMTPAIVLDPLGRLFLVTGTPGGSTIITTVFQTIVGAIDDGMGVADLVRAPRVHHQHLPDLIQYEVGGVMFEAFVRLEEMGHRFRPVRTLGNVQAILVLPDGTRTGMADPRGAGRALGTGE